MLRQLTDLNFEWRESIKVMPSLLAVKEGISAWILRTVMHRHAQVYSRCREVSKMGLFTRISKNFLMLLFCKRFLRRGLKESDASDHKFTVHEYINQFWRHQICKHYQNITSKLVFTIVLGIYCKFCVLRFNWKFADLLLFSLLQNRARLRAFARLSTPDRHRERNMSMSKACIKAFTSRQLFKHPSWVFLF